MISTCLRCDYRKGEGWRRGGGGGQSTLWPIKCRQNLLMWDLCDIFTCEKNTGKNIYPVLHTETLRWCPSSGTNKTLYIALAQCASAYEFFAVYFDFCWGWYLETTWLSLHRLVTETWYSVPQDFSSEFVTFQTRIRVQIPVPDKSKKNVKAIASLNRHQVVKISFCEIKNAKFFLKKICLVGFGSILFSNTA